MADDDDDDFDTAAAVGTASCSKWSQRLCKRKPSIGKSEKLAGESLLSCANSKQKPQIKAASDWELWEQRLYEADRLDCLRAQRDTRRSYAIPPSQKFNSLQCMLDELEMVNMDSGQSEPLPEPVVTESSLSIVEVIQRDFCESPTYVEDDVPEDVDSPWFRFRGKKIKTFFKHRRKSIAVKISDDEDCLSSCSELSVQEDYNTQVPTTTHRAFDANSSQKICENLLSLSAFLTQNPNKSIDLPEKHIDQMDCTIDEIRDYQYEDVTDILHEIGYLIDNTGKQFDENCDSKITNNAELSLFCERTRETHGKATEHIEKSGGNSQLQEKETMELALLEEIPLSEWQPIDINDSKSEELKDFKELEVAAFSEWQPVNNTQAIEFRTASNKVMKLTEEMRQKAAMLMADLETADIEQPKEGSALNNNTQAIEFRTASNKVMKLTEEMRQKAAMLMADLETPEIGQPKEGTDLNKTMEKTTKEEDIRADFDFLDEIPFSEWQPMEIPENKPVQLDLIPKYQHSLDEASSSKKDKVANLRAPSKFNHSQENRPFPETAIGFRTASDKVMIVTKEMQAKAAKLMADLETGDNHRNVQGENNLGRSESVIEAPGAKLTDAIGFRTASNKVLTVTKEMQQRASLLMADLEAEEITANAQVNVDLPETELPTAIMFRTASAKVMPFTKEMQRKAELLMSDLEAGSVYSQNIPVESLVKTEPSYSEKHRETTTESRSNGFSEKAMQLSDENRQRAAMLMADLEFGTVNQTETQIEQSDMVQLKISPTKSRVESTPASKATTESLATADSVCKLNAEIDGIKPLEPESNFNSPKCTPELQSSLLQLSERSPLDRATKSSIIARRNLLSLNKRRKQKLKVENCNLNSGCTPYRVFAPMEASTSTPMPTRRESVKNNKKSHSAMRDRSFSQDSPSRQSKPVNKRKSEEALSPIYAPTTKTRRIGLSRIRNKSTNEI